MAYQNTGQESATVIRSLIALLRPRQWVKSGFVVAPLIFAREFLDPSSVASTFLAVFLFSVASSAVYIINDIRDIEYDRKHPTKSKTRPLAAGLVTIPQALGLLGLLCGVLAWGYVVAPSVILVILAYIGLSIAYTFVLKNQPVIDIFTIALGFVLRVYAGVAALSLPVSSWMFVTTFCLALYLAAIKRRQEIAQSGQTGRKVLESYSLSLVDRYAEMSATGAIVFYGLFVMSTQPDMTMTIPFVLFGLYRYWFVVETLNSGESPTDAVLSDWPLLLTVLLWIGSCAWVLWPA